jgi:hypothetical protein
MREFKGILENLFNYLYVVNPICDLDERLLFTFI